MLDSVRRLAPGPLCNQQGKEISDSYNPTRSGSPTPQTASLQYPIPAGQNTRIADRCGRTCDLCKTKGYMNFTILFEVISLHAKLMFLVLNPKRHHCKTAYTMGCWPSPYCLKSTLKTGETNPTDASKTNQSTKLMCLSQPPQAALQYRRRWGT